MSFKTEVISGAEEKYQDMLAGKTEPAIHPNLQVASSAGYASKRERFVQRIEEERKNFNNAIKTVNSRREGRLADQTQHKKNLAIDRSHFGGVIATSIIYILLMALFMYAYKNLDLSTWINEKLLPLTGQDFLTAISFEGNIIPQICMILGIIVAVIMFFIMVSETGLIGAAIIGVICGGLTALVARVLVFAVGYAIFFLLQPWGALALAGVVLILNMIFGRKLMTKEYIARKWLFTLACVAVGAAVFLLIR